MVHLIRSVYGCDEYEVLWRDWHWANDSINRIVRDRNERKRWDLQATLLSCAYAFGGSEGGAAKGWQELFDSTITVEEKRAMREQQEQHELELLAEQRKERMAMMLSMQEQARKEAVERGEEEPPAEKQVFFIQQ